MSWRNNRDSGRAIQSRPAKTTFLMSNWLNGIYKRIVFLPCTFVVDHKFEHTVPIRSTERNRVFSRNTTYRREWSSDVGVKHGKFELKVFQARKRLPCIWFRIEFWNVSAVHLRLKKVLAWRAEEQARNSRVGHLWYIAQELPCRSRGDALFCQYEGQETPGMSTLQYHDWIVHYQTSLLCKNIIQKLPEISMRQNVTWKLLFVQAHRWKYLHHRPR